MPAVMSTAVRYWFSVVAVTCYITPPLCPAEQDRLASASHQKSLALRYAIIKPTSGCQWPGKDYVMLTGLLIPVIQFDKAGW